MQIKSEISGVIWIGRVYERGAWGDVTRNHALGLKQIGFPIRVCPVGAIHYDMKIEVDHYIKPLLKGDVGPWPAVVIDKGLEFGHKVKADGMVKIGRALFETDRIPASMVADSNLYDEIWVPSQFNFQTFSRSGVPAEKIRVIPYAVDTDIYKPHNRQFPIPDKRKFVFLAVFSLSWKKGYDLLLEAYFKEFTINDDVTLVMKVLKSPEQIEDISTKDHILNSVSGTIDLKRKDLPHVVFIEETLARDRMLDLYAACDLYISTDRANGWGMSFMEAMAMGKPAATINWSGSTEFMNRTNSLLIQTTGLLVPVDSKFVTQAPHFAGHQWAEVRVEEVQRVMRYAYQHPVELKQIAERGMKDIRENYSLEAVARKVAAAVSEISMIPMRYSGKPRLGLKKAYTLEFWFRVFYQRLRYWFSF